MRNHRQTTKNFYDSIAEHSFKEWFHNDTLLPLLKDFTHTLPSKPLILDMGCGVGGESSRLLSLNVDVIGIDFSPVSLKIAKENAPGANFALMDIVDLGFHQETFHGILDAAVLFHFTRGEQNTIMGRLSSLLKPNGSFLSFYPGGDFEGIQRLSINGWNLKRYSRFLPIEEWVRQVSAKGFSLIKQQPFKSKGFSYALFKKQPL